MSKNKIILNNTLALYIRLLVALFLSLYSTRILLENLGVEDFGLYGTIVGVVALFSFFQTTLSGAMNRFLNVEMVKGSIFYIQKIFFTALILHILIGFFLCLLVEVVGLWLINSYIKIPLDKINITFQVFHLSVMSLFFLVITVPFEAMLMAKEKFGIYAIISIIDIVLKLLLAYILIFFNHDKLLYYAIGIVFIVIFIRLIYVIYCELNICETRIQLNNLDNDFLRKIIIFIGWDLYGNFCVIFKTHGITLLMNNFFGLIAVASIQVSNQINAALQNLSSNLLIAVKPQLMRSYANSDTERMNLLTFYSAKYSYYLMLIFCAPVISNIDYILRLWLKSPPDYAKTIIVFMLITSLIDVIFSPIIILIHATGNVKKISFLTGTIIFLSVLLVYYLFELGFDYYYAYIVFIFNSILGAFINIWIVQSLIEKFNVSDFVRSVLINIFITTSAILLAIKMIGNYFIVNDFYDFIIIFTIETLIVILLIYYLGVERNHRILIKKYIKLK
ncbi:MATE family efflux transporter [Acinetobacter sp. GXMZU3951]